MAIRLSIVVDSTEFRTLLGAYPRALTFAWQRSKKAAVEHYRKLLNLDWHASMYYAPRRTFPLNVIQTISRKSTYNAQTQTIKFGSSLVRNVKGELELKAQTIGATRRPSGSDTFFVPFNRRKRKPPRGKSKFSKDRVLYKKIGKDKVEPVGYLPDKVSPEGGLFHPEKALKPTETFLRVRLGVEVRKELARIERIVGLRR